MPASPRPRWRKPVLLLVVAAAVLAAGAWAWSRRGGEGEAGGYRTVPVEQGDIRVTSSSTGALSALSTVVVGSEISGRVTDVLVDFNDTVRRGQVLARIDASTYEAQIAQGNAAIGSAQANAAQSAAALRNAELDYARKAELGRQQLIARSEVDLARSALDQARAQLAASRAQITQQQAGTRTARLNVGRTEIRSPVDGVVLTRTVEPGQTVAASLQAPELFKLAEDLSKMQIELAVDEADIGQLKVGQRASFTVDAFPERRFVGEVRQVRLSATTTNNVVTYPVVIQVDNTEGLLLPGMTANAEIEVSRRDDVLRVPNAALRFKPAEDAAGGPGASQAPGGAGGGRAGMADDLSALAASLSLTAPQQAAFDAALAQMRERMQARTAAPAAGQGGSRLFGPGGGRGGPGGARGGGAPGGAAAGAARQRMAERMNQQFAAFRASLSEPQRERWDAGLSALVVARRAPLYKLVAGKPEMVMVRVGASDGSFTEVSGNIRAGDLVVTGAERAAK